MVDEQFDTGTKVWAKVKGHPWWPGQVADPDDLSQLVKSQKPKRLPHSIPILFYGANNYGWLQTDAVRHFDDPSVEVPRKGGALQDAIQRARADDAPDGKLKVFEDDGDSESGENDEEDDENEAVEDEEDDVDENPKSSARKSKSVRKTPSKTPISERKSKNGKRKAENDETPSKRKRREKSEQDDDEDAEEPETKKKAGKTKTPSKAKKVNKRVEEQAEEPEKKKEKTRSAHDQLMYFRHKVQKMMKESPETLAASPKIDGIMTEVEAFPMTLNLLKDTKMGKLMKRMSQIKFTEDPYGIKDRTHRLMKRWKNDFAENLDKDAASEDTEVKKQPTEEISSISSSNKDEKENHRESPVKDSTTIVANTTTTVASPIKKKEVSSTLEENVKNSVDESSEIRSSVKESNAKQEPVVVSREEKAENKGSDAEDLLSAEILNE